MRNKIQSFDQLAFLQHRCKFSEQYVAEMHSVAVQKSRKVLGGPSMYVVFANGGSTWWSLVTGSVIAKSIVSKGIVLVYTLSR